MGTEFWLVSSKFGFCDQKLRLPNRKTLVFNMNRTFLRSVYSAFLSFENRRHLVKLKLLRSLLQNVEPRRESWKYHAHLTPNAGRSKNGSGMASHLNSRRRYKGRRKMGRGTMGNRSSTFQESVNWFTPVEWLRCHRAFILRLKFRPPEQRPARVGDPEVAQWICR